MYGLLTAPANNEVVLIRRPMIFNVILHADVQGESILVIPNVKV